VGNVLLILDKNGNGPEPANCDDGGIDDAYVDGSGGFEADLAKDVSSSCRQNASNTG
jgi:hypothetical protein